MTNIWLRRAELLLCPCGWSGTAILYDYSPRKWLEPLREYWQIMRSQNMCPHDAYIKATNEIDGLRS